MKKMHQKLVRDRIPEIIEKANKDYQICILDNDEYIQALKNKVREEADEVVASASRQELVEELSDVLEVVEALMDVYQIDQEEIKKIKEQKVIKNGGFKDKIFLEYVIEDES